MQSTKPKLNVRLLRRIARHILKEPKRFLMSCSVLKATTQREWQMHMSYAPDASKTIPPCGTAACIAGWADILSGGSGENDITAPLIARAARVLGVAISYTWSNHTLFSSLNWPSPFARQYRKAKRPSQRAKIAAARIEHLIKTGE